MVQKFIVKLYNEKTKKKLETNKYSLVQKMIMDELVKGQNYLAEKCNPMYEEWNARFDQLYPNDDEDRFDPDSKYMNFIRAKQDRVLKEFNHGSPFIDKFYSNEEGSIAVKTIFGNYSLILIPVE